MKFDYTVVLGSLIGAAVAIGNFAGICIVVRRSSTSRMRSAAKPHYKLSYNSQDAFAGGVDHRVHRGTLLPALCQRSAACCSRVLRSTTCK
ncbi:MAG: hypothetical protein ACLTGJ_08665 [Faecalibacterium prausnitzii]